MKIELKNVKVSNHLSQETIAFTASVYVNGKRSFTAENRGNGGTNFYYPVTGKSRSVITEAEEYAKTLPDLDGQFGKLSMNLDLLIGELLDEYQMNKEFKRRCKTKTIAITPDCAPGEFIAFGVPYSARVKAHILKKYPDAEIVNERFL